MEQNHIKQFCAYGNLKEAAYRLYEDGWDGANEGSTIVDLQLEYDLSQEDAEEVFGYIIQFEEEDGIERDEFGNVIEEEYD